MEPALARTLWHLLEAINAVTYFSPECRDAPARLGLKGFWMGYFGCRAAPMGPVPPAVVEATFFNFHPARVRRAIPDAWERATPDALVDARAAAAATALRRLLGDGGAEHIAEQVVPPARAAIDSARPTGALFTANRDVAPPGDPVAALWQVTTTLREHRGDAHVALLVGAGLDGCQAHVLFAAGERRSPELYQQSRGWSPDDWTAATARLAARGLVTSTGDITAVGRDLRAHIERSTDELAVGAFAVLGDDGASQLIDDLRPAAPQIATAEEIPFPNPMGLPPPTAR